LKNIYDPLSGLYAISDDLLTPRRSILAQTEAVLRGGARLFQLRDKRSSDEELAPIARSLRELCDDYGAKLIINDRLELAKNAHGVHIGQADETLEKALQTLGKAAIIGVSCYGDLNRAVAAQKRGASYVSFGACFRSVTKPNAAIVDGNIFERAKKTLQIPICAIGGITTKNAPELLRRGVDMLAVVSDLWRRDDWQKTAETFAASLAMKS
jgi:thiamine-phosphate pyrophosphorylase